MRGRKIRGELVVTLAFAVVKAVAVLWLIRLAEELYPAVLLGIYLLSRRVVSTLPNLTAFGVSNTLQRYIPLNGDDPATNVRFITAGTAIVVAINSLVFAAFFLLGGRAVVLLFPDSGGYPDLVPFALWTVALCALVALHFVVYGVLLGRRRMLFAQCVDLLVVGVWQIVAFFYYGASATPPLVTRFQVLAMLATTLPLAGALIISEARRAATRSVAPTRSICRALLAYGSSRGGVTFLDAMLVTLGPWLLRHSPEAMAYLIMALTIVRVASSALGSLNSATSVAVASLLGRRDEHAIRTGINLMIGFVAVPSVLGIAVLAPFLGRLIAAWLRSPLAISEVGTVAPYLLLALPWAAVFHGLKGIVDVQEVFPHNLVNLAASNVVLWVVYVMLAIVASPMIAAVIAIVVAHMVLAMATLYALRRWLMPLNYFAAGRLVAIAALAWGVCLVAARATSSMSTIPGLGWAMVTMTLVFVTSAAAFLFSPRHPFARDLIALVLRGQLPSVAS